MITISQKIAEFIIIIALVIFGMDFARAKPETDKAANFLYDFGIFLTGICILLIAKKFCQLFITSSDEQAIVLSVAFFLIIFRKMLTVLAIGIIGYLSAVDNAFSKRVVPKLVIKSMDPSAPKPTELSLGALRVGHIVILIISLLLTAISSAFPGLTSSRINFTVDYLQKLRMFFVGTAGQRIVFMFWLLFFVIFWMMIAAYVHRLYKNFIYILEEKYNEVRDATPLGVAIIILFFARKIFLYIFVSGKFWWQDIMFWGLILIASILIFLLGIRVFKTLERMGRP